MSGQLRQADQALQGYLESLLGGAPPARFHGWLFRVGELRLVLPAEQCAGVVEWQGPAPRESGPWVLGTLREAGVKVVDSARLVVPAERRAAVLGAVPRPYTQVLLLAEGRWGLAAHDAVEPVDADPEAVQWRSGGGPRPWLAGMLPERRCPVLDGVAVARLLEQAAR